MAKKAQKSVPKSKPVPEKKQKQVQPKKYLKTIDAQARIIKSKQQRIFLLSAERKDNENWQFTVQGTKLKNYIVKISTQVFCSCMDFTMKKKPCKHIYFIVTQVAQNDQILDFFKNSKTISKNAYKLLDEQLKKRLKSRLQALNNPQKKDIDLKDDTDCVICFTQMDKQKQALSDCNTCKKYFHLQCINRWKQQSPTCPLCRGSLMPTGSNPLDKLLKISV